MTTQLKISGMSCEMCVRHVTNALQGVEGVESANVSLEQGSATVEHDGVDISAMLEAVREEGYEAEVG
jgi:copper chaperone CopZ